MGSGRWTTLETLKAETRLLALLRCGAVVEFPGGVRLGAWTNIDGLKIYVGTAAVPVLAEFACTAGGLAQALAYRQRMDSRSEERQLSTSSTRAKA